jgi:hypothetical protein
MSDSTSSGTFVPYSFGGQIPFYVYQSSTQDSITVNKVIIGQSTNKWKIEMDEDDGNKLKFYFSSDSGTSWNAVMEISPNV